MGLSTELLVLNAVDREHLCMRAHHVTVDVRGVQHGTRAVERTMLHRGPLDYYTQWSQEGVCGGGHSYMQSLPCT